MSLRRSTPLTLVPRGLSDALDGTNVFSGAMASLQHLVPDPSTRGLWQCRPAAQNLAFLSGGGGGGAFSPGFSPGFGPAGGGGGGPAGMISVMKVIGNMVYGMVASPDFPGHDAPFAYNLLTNAFA